MGPLYALMQKYNFAFSAVVNCFHKCIQWRQQQKTLYAYMQCYMYFILMSEGVCGSQCFLYYGRRVRMALWVVQDADPRSRPKAPLFAKIQEKNPSKSLSSSVTQQIVLYKNPSVPETQKKDMKLPVSPKQKISR